MQFPFEDLPTELALEIISLAASSPLTECISSGPRAYYTTALALASVSYKMRLATMPHLLHTVVLSTPHHAISFISAVHLQKTHAQTGSRLALSYPPLIRRFWATDCWEPLQDASPLDNPIDYSTLYQVMRGTQSFGINIRSLHLLYNGLASEGAAPDVDWACRRVTFAGDWWRWRPLTSSSEGCAFLAQITHLVMWIRNLEPPPPPSAEHLAVVPSWVESIPFDRMPALRHLAFPLLQNSVVHPGSRSLQIPTQMLVYSAAPGKHNPMIFREWVLGCDPLAHGVVVPFRVTPFAGNLNWEGAFVEGLGDEVWTMGKQLRQGKSALRFGLA